MTNQTPRDRAVEMLVAHQPSHIVNSHDGTYVCLCDAAVPVPGGFDSDAFAIDWEARAVAVCAHQIDMLAAAGLLPDREEWGVQDIDLGDAFGGHVTTSVSEDGARFAASAGDRVVHRYVTEWRTA